MDDEELQSRWRSAARLRKSGLEMGGWDLAVRLGEDRGQCGGRDVLGFSQSAPNLGTRP